MLGAILLPPVAERVAIPLQGLPVALNLPVPIYILVERGCVGPISVLTKNTTQCPWLGHDPGPPI